MQVVTRGRTSSIGWLLVTCLVIFAAAGIPMARAHPPQGDAIIGNGTIQLGIHPQGHLNVPGPPSAGGTGFVGLRYLPTNNEATAPGCLCEGWGAADAISGVTGYANEFTDGVVNIDVVSFVSTPSTAVSVVEIGTTLRVTHNYHPSPVTPNLYEVVVTLENISGDSIEPRYRRVMDWDVEPTAFNEFVTIQRGTPPAANLLYSSNDGFATANPLGTRSTRNPAAENSDFTDLGPGDDGALFDFGFDPLVPGGRVTFKTFYGAAGNETDAIDAVGLAGAEVFSFGQPNIGDVDGDGVPDGPGEGMPNTFIFAFSGVGGEPIIDRQAPTCRIQSRTMNVITIRVQDTGSGLASIDTDSIENIASITPGDVTFAPPTTNPVDETATKAATGTRARWRLKATDAEGNSTRCTASGIITF